MEWLTLCLQFLVVPVLAWLIRIESRLAGLESQLEIIKTIVLDGKCDKK